MDRPTPPDSTAKKPAASKPTEQRGLPHNRERRSVPHWSLVSAALLMFGALLYLILPYLSPITLSIAILILLYPSRRTRELKPLLLIVWIVLIIALWWRLNALLTPFIIAFVLAYAIDPVIEWAVSKGLPRIIVILVIIGLILGAMVGVGFLIVPRLIEEISDLATTLPRWFSQIKHWGEYSFIPWFNNLELPIGDLWKDIQGKLPKLVQNILERFTDWSSSALSGAVTVLSGIANLILIPILTVYFLQEFNNIREIVYKAIPREQKRLAVRLFNGLNEVLSGYIRGQMLVSLFLATWIGMGLWLFAGVPYALLLGITAGLANLLPYVGTWSAGLLTLIIAVAQPDPLSTVVKSLAVFMSGQALEGNFITPRIVGDKVGLHPLVVIFVVLLFATLIGFIGMIIAIPVTASILVILKIWKTRHESPKPAPAEE